MPSEIWSSQGTYSWTCPAGVTSVQAICIGAGGGGAAGPSSGGCGGGAGYASGSAVPVTPGDSYTVVVGAGGQGAGGQVTPSQDGTNSAFYGDDSTLIYAYPGYRGQGNGYNGPGGGGETSGSVGGTHTGNGQNGSSSYGGAAYGGGGGGAWGIDGSAGSGDNPGGGGGGTNSVFQAGSGADGQVSLSWSVPVITGSGSCTLTLAATGEQAGLVTGSGVCLLGFDAGSTPVVVQKMIISLAAHAGERPDGTPYPAGMALFGVGGVFGYLDGYENGGLSGSFALVAGSDAAGNAYPAGLMVTQVTLTTVTQTPATPPGGAVLYYKGGTVFALGTSGNPISLGAT